MTLILKGYISEIGAFQSIAFVKSLSPQSQASYEPVYSVGSEILPAKIDADRQLIKEVAMDIGKQAVSHLRTMYPAAFEVLRPSGAMSLRNCIHNEIMAALEVVDAVEIKARLDRRKADRRHLHKIYDSVRSQP